jgi:hypothetical protein
VCRRRIVLISNLLAIGPKGPGVERAVFFGFGWMLSAGAVGAVVGSIATGTAGLTIWALSGAAVVSAQWALVRRQLQFAPLPWLAATALGSFLAGYVYVYTGIAVGDGGEDALRGGVTVALAGGLMMGAPQAAFIRDPRIRWWAWILATMIGVLAAWSVDLGGLWYSIHGHVPRWIGAIAGTSGYWVAISLPQAFLIGWAMRRRTPPTTAKIVS